MADGWYRVSWLYGGAQRERIVLAASEEQAIRMAVGEPSPGSIVEVTPLRRFQPGAPASVLRYWLGQVLWLTVAGVAAILVAALAVKIITWALFIGGE